MEQHVFNKCPNHPDSDPHCKECGEAEGHHWHIDEFEQYAQEVRAAHGKPPDDENKGGP